MKMTREDFDRAEKLTEKLRKYLTRELGREPTEEELASKLPIFLCKVP